MKCDGTPTSIPSPCRLVKVSAMNTGEWYPMPDPRPRPRPRPRPMLDAGRALQASTLSLSFSPSLSREMHLRRKGEEKKVAEGEGPRPATI